MFLKFIIQIIYKPVIPALLVSIIISYSFDRFLISCWLFKDKLLKIILVQNT
jgi:hypothetical protein